MTRRSRHGRGGKRFSTAASGRDWRHGRFRVIAVPAIDETKAAFPRELWGTCGTTWRSSEASTVTVELLRDPYGLVVCARCEACGGRYEAMSDVRAFPALIGQDVGAVPEAVRSQILTSTAPITDIWAPAHVACDNEPKQFHTPEPVQQFVDAVVAAARADVGRGNPFPGHVSLLQTDGQVLSYPIYDVPQSSPDDLERENTMAARKAAVRNLIDARDLDIIAAVVVSEAWNSAPEPDSAGAYPPAWMDPDRSEVLTVVLCTPTFGRFGVSPIERRGGAIGEGPGHCGPLTWAPLGSESLLVDGLFATSPIEPWDEDEKRRQAGIDFGTPSEG